MMLNDPNNPLTEAAEKSFADILEEFESAHKDARRESKPGSPKRGRGKSRPAARQRLQGTVVGVAGDFVLIDHGAKSEGVIPRTDLLNAEGNLAVKVGDSFDVAITGFNAEGAATLSRVTGPRPRDWDDLERAFKAREIIAGRVTGVVKGGLTVDVGVRAFLPGSRSGIRDSAEMQKLAGQEIRCRIIKLDVDNEDLVIDRRSVMDEEADQMRRNAVETLEEGAVVKGTVRSLTPYGAFLDIGGGVDGLLHVGDISWSRVTNPETVLAVGDILDVRILKLDKQAGKIGLGLKQMTRDPWQEAVTTLKPGDRVTGEVTRLTDFGAFVEIMPGVEGLIHVSEMSWTKRVKRPGDVLKKGERVEAAVLKVDAENSRLSLGLKQVLANPWDTIQERYPVGKVVEGKVSRLAAFGAFVELEEGVDGLIHVSEITSEKRVQNPGDMLKVGQTVRAAVLSAEAESRRLKLSMKQLEATASDEFAQDVTVGDQVTGRIVRVDGQVVRVQLDEGVEGICIFSVESRPDSAIPVTGGSLAEQLAAAWKGTAKLPSSAAPAPYREGELRSFTIKAIDPSGKKIELAPA